MHLLIYLLSYLLFCVQNVMIVSHTKCNVYWRYYMYLVLTVVLLFCDKSSTAYLILDKLVRYFGVLTIIGYLVGLYLLPNHLLYNSNRYLFMCLYLFVGVSYICALMLTNSHRREVIRKEESNK